MRVIMSNNYYHSRVVLIFLILLNLMPWKFACRVLSREFNIYNQRHTARNTFIYTYTLLLLVITYYHLSVNEIRLFPVIILWSPITRNDFIFRICAVSWSIVHLLQSDIKFRYRADEAHEIKN